MPALYLPTQIGYLPTGANGTAGTSTLYFGRDVSATYDAVGLGAGGRPDYLSVINIPLTQRTANGTLVKKGIVQMDVSAIVSGAVNRPQFPSVLSLTFKEVLVCENGVTKGMMILGSQTYSTGSA